MPTSVNWTETGSPGEPLATRKSPGYGSKAWSRCDIIPFPVTGKANLNCPNRAGQFFHRRR